MAGKGVGGGTRPQEHQPSGHPQGARPCLLGFVGGSTCRVKGRGAASQGSCLTSQPHTAPSRAPPCSSQPHTTLHPPTSPPTPAALPPTPCCLLCLLCNEKTREQDDNNDNIDEINDPSVPGSTDKCQANEDAFKRTMDDVHLPPGHSPRCQYWLLPPARQWRRQPHRGWPLWHSPFPAASH